MSAAVVVPGGFGISFRQPLQPAQILTGAQQGEIAVDILIVQDTAIIEWLRTADDAPPVVAVMAVIVLCEDSDLTAAVASSSWDASLDLARRWRGDPGREADAPSFRVTALRDKAHAQPRANDIARAVAAGVHRRWGWPVSMSDYTLEVCALWLGSGVVVVGLPLTAGWQACERTSKGGFFPVERRAAQTSDGGKYDHSQPRLRPSACYGLLLAAEMQPSDLLVDPMCGVGSIPAVALQRFGASFALGGDSCAHAVADAAGCVRASGLDTARWDVRQLPLRSGVVDKLVVDMPWGNRGKGSLDQPTLLAALIEIGRVLTEGGTAALLLLRAAADRISRLDCGSLVLVEVRSVSVGGWPVAIVLLKKACSTVGQLEGANSRCAEDGDQTLLEGEHVPPPPVPGQSLPPKSLPAHPSVDPALPPQSASLPPLQPPSLLPPPSSTSNGCCGAVRVCERLEAYPLGELLVAAFPSLVRSISNARRIVRHRRVCIQSCPDAPLHWQSRVVTGETLIVRPHTARHQPLDTLVAYYAKEPLTVLWETTAWLCVLKPSSSVGVLHGSRSLANSILALRQERLRHGQRQGKWQGQRLEKCEQETAPVVSSTAAPVTEATLAVAEVANAAIAAETAVVAKAAVAAETADQAATPRHADDEHVDEHPWSVAYSGDARVGGAWLVAKTPHAALSVLLDPSTVQLVWRAVFCGVPTREMMGAWGLGDAEVLRVGRSVRFVSLTEASFRTAASEMAAWRLAAAAAGHPVVGDRPHCDDPHSKSACLWVCRVLVYPTEVDGSSGVPMSDGFCAPPMRFDRLFEREEQVAEQAERGLLQPEYHSFLLDLRAVNAAKMRVACADL